MSPFLRSPFLSSDPEPWTIPSKDEISLLSKALPDPFLEGTHWKRIRWHYSAASVAIKFLKTLPQNTLSRVRKVILHEDRLSMCRSECHGLGLIPFCIRNPEMHVERRVSLWRNILVTDLYGWRETRSIRGYRIVVEKKGKADDYAFSTRDLDHIRRD